MATNIERCVLYQKKCYLKSFQEIWTLYQDNESMIHVIFIRLTIMLWTADGD